MTTSAPRTVGLTGGIELEVLEDGTGTPLVMVCGTSQDLRLFAPLVPAFAAGRRVITYNHRGIGASTRDASTISVGLLADDLAALLDALQIPRADVLGWSLGSAVAQELALRSPDRVATLTLASTWARTDPFQASVFALLSQPWRTGHRDVGLAGLSIAYSPEFVRSPGFMPLMAQLEPLFPSTSAQVATVAEQWDADLAHDTLDRLDQITAPTLVITGDQDLLTPAVMGRDVAHRIAGSRLEQFRGPGSSHALLFERAEELAKLVNDFLGEHPLDT